MRHYSQNARWLLWFTPFRGLSVSAAYITPFFLAHGLSTTQIFLLQSIFSAAYLLWEIPSGIIADRLGRAFSIKISAPIAAISMIAYGLSGEFWQFALCELVLALANGLISGVDTALLVDSLAADGRKHEYVKISQRIKALEFASTAGAVPLAIVLVHFWGINATLVADGVGTLLGIGIVMKLVEAPRSAKPARQSALQAASSLVRNANARWLIALGSSLNTATYLAAWLAALYYQQLGIPVALFGAVLAIRNLFKAWIAHRVQHNSSVHKIMPRYVWLAGATYLAMATQQLWLVWAVLGHDVIHALSRSPIEKRLNGHIDETHRATMNSLSNLVQRLCFMVAGPLVGLAVDRVGLRVGLVVTGLACSSAASIAVWRLRSLKSLD